MNPLMEQLHDIEGIDPISWWPLGIGWWIVIGAVLAATTAFLIFLIRRRVFLRSWKNDTLRKLDALENHLTEQTAREAAITLSEYLRRIAVHRYSREECAGLTGYKWLLWLKERDPKGFNWTNKGKPLVDAPYSPETSSISPEELKLLIQAVKGWVK